MSSRSGTGTVFITKCVVHVIIDITSYNESMHIPEGLVRQKLPEISIIINKCVTNSMNNARIVFFYSSSSLNNMYLYKLNCDVILPIISTHQQLPSLSITNNIWR